VPSAPSKQARRRSNSSVKAIDTAPAKPARVVLVVACALLDGRGRVLLAKRPAGVALAGLWEFPGGKVEPNETPERALVRELAEELAIQVAPARLAPLTFASHDYGDFHLLMPLFLCRSWHGSVRAQQGQELAWVWAQELGRYAMPAADEPLKAALVRYQRACGDPRRAPKARRANAGAQRR
jgi:8-oxo-dGTP diphosphatase